MDELTKNQIQPAARPVDSFIQPERVQVAAPAPVQLMPNPGGIRVIDQGSGGNVQGSNQFAELAQALAPFNQRLTEFAGAGLNLYASNEYQKGQQEALLAQAKAEQQIRASGEEFAADTRRLQNTDPEAAVMLDRVNPYREAGRVNQLSRIAGSEIKSELMSEYRNTPDVVTWKDGDPRLTEIRARAVNRVLERYRINQSTPGFLDFVLPQIGEGMDKVVAQHQQDRVKYLKATVGPAAAAEAISIYAAAREQGWVEWVAFDLATGQPTRRRAELGSKEFEEGIRVNMTVIADGIFREAGLQGEATEMLGDMFQRIAGTAGANGDPALARIASQVAVGPVRADGTRMTAGERYGLEMFESQDKFWSMKARRDERQLKQGLQAFDEALLRITAETPEDGPERGARIAMVINEFADRGLPLAQLNERADAALTGADRLYARGFSAEPAQEYLDRVAGMPIGPWNPTEFDKQIQRVLASVAPGDREEIRRRANSIRAEKEGRRGKLDPLAQPIILSNIKDVLARFYPKDTDVAVLRGADVTALLAWGDANVSAASNRLLSTFQAVASDAIDQATVKKGGALTPAETTTVVQKALRDAAANEALMRPLLPGSSTGEPSVGGAPAQPRPPGATNRPPPPPGMKPSPLPTVTRSNLDNLPTERLKRPEPVLGFNDAAEEAARIANGERPSASVIRAARRAGMTPGQFILRQLDAYPQAPMPPEMRRQLQSNSSGPQAVANNMSALAMASAPVQRAGNWFLNALMPPAAAGTMAPNMRFYGGGRDAGGPFTGEGYTPLRGVQITSAVDASGEPGFDMVIENGRRGARLAWPTSFEVLRVVRGSRSEFRREAGDPRRGYGNLVEIRFTDPNTGRTVDALSAHHDNINPALQVGRRFPAGTWLGTQGRTGSTTGAHVSLDFFDPGAKTASGATLRVRDSFRDRFARGDRFGAPEGQLRGGGFTSRDRRGQALIQTARRMGVSPADLAAIFSFETGGTLSPNESGRGAAAGRVGLIQAGPNEMRSYDIRPGQTFEQQLAGVERYFRSRGVRPGMGLEDLYAIVNGGNPRAGFTPDGNGVIARSPETLRQLRIHREQAIRRLGLRPTRGGS
jgi:hypothetical protein